LRLRFEADPRVIEVVVEKGDELAIAVTDGPVFRARVGRRYTLQADRSGWGHWKEVRR
jgi:hypothetical protein